ncbi:MAG: hypothetical protein ACRDHF_09280 [Tepidiformaceae bacterium]
MIAFRGPVRATFTFGPRHAVTFGAVPHRFDASPSALFSSGLEGFRIGVAQQQAFASGVGTALSLAGMPLPWQDLFNAAYLFTTKGKARPATQRISSTVNGVTFSQQRLVRNVF